MKRVALASLALLLWSARAAADEPPADPEPPQAPEAPKTEKEETGGEVRIIGNKADSLQKVPGSGTVITPEALRRQQPVDTAEVLRRVPGVQVRQEFSGGSRIDVSIRGLESGRSRRVLMLEDGIPIALNPYSEPDLNHAPVIERYRSIEVVKGSGNILFGPQTLAGTINFITIAPPDHQTVTADVDYGTYGYVRGMAQYGDTIGDARYVTQVLYRHGEGFRNQPFDQVSGLAKVVVPTGKSGEATVKLDFQRDDAASDDIGVTRDMFKANPRRPTLSPDAQSIMNRYAASLTHEERLGSSTKLKTLVYGYMSDRDWRRPDWTRNPAPGDHYLRVNGDPSVPGGAIFFQNGNSILARDYSVIGVEPRFEHRWKLGAVEQTFDFGGRLLEEQAHYQQRTGAYPQTWSGALDFEQKRKSLAGAVYLQDRIAFGENLIVTPGIRVEAVHSKTYTLRENDLDKYDTGDKTTTGVIPGIGIVYGTKRASVFGNMHYGFAPPRITSSVSAHGAGQMLEGDRGISYELGTRGQQTRWLRAEATGFLSNYMNQVSVNPNTSGEGNLADVGATNIYGVESGLVLSFDKIVDALPSAGLEAVDLGARYTYSHATFRYGPLAGKFLPYAPLHSLNANVDVEHRTGFGGQVAYTFVSSQFTDGSNTVPEDVFGVVGRINERHIFDATAHYRWKPTGLTFRLSAKNVFDTTYIIARRPEGIFPGPYRQILAGVRWEFEPARWFGRGRTD
jgi:Fe(3+) dicitrate transport protein